MSQTTTAPVRVPLRATLTSPLHHGGGTAGNTALLRAQDIVLPDGSAARVPFVSGNSVRHTLRAALAWHLVRVLALPDGSLPKAVADLLWSGGAITRTGSQADLALARRVDELLPQLTLMGYSAGSDMVAGTLWVEHMHLVCAENAWRLGPAEAALPHAARGAGAYRGEEFGTRHDLGGTAVDRFIADALGEPAASTQMIYDLQVLKAGAVLAGGVELCAAATAEHRRVLLVAIDEAAPERDGARTVQLAAKAAVGYGQARLHADLGVLGDVGEARAWWEEHLAAHRAEILELLDEVTR